MPVYANDQLGQLLGAAIAGIGERRRANRDRALALEDRSRSQALQNYQLGREGVRLTANDGAELTKGIPFAELAQIVPAVDVQPPAAFPPAPPSPPMPGLAAALSSGPAPTAPPSPPSGVPGAFIPGVGFHAPSAMPSAMPSGGTAMGSGMEPPMVTPQPFQRFTFGDGYVVDNNVRRQQQAEDAQARFTATLAQAIAQAQGKTLGDPEGTALARDAQRAQTDRATAAAARDRYAVEHPAPQAPVIGSPEWMAAERFKASLRPPPTASFTFLPGTDAQGKPVTVVGNTRTGQLTPTTIGRPAAGQRQTATERQTLAQAGEVSQANQLLDHYSDPTVMSQVAKKVGLLGNFANTPEGRQFNQAADQFLTLTAFALSGKRVTAQELERLKQSYIPQPGDDPGTLQRKAAARAERIAAMQQAGGATPASPSSPSSAPTGGSLFDDLVPKGHP